MSVNSESNKRKSTSNKIEKNYKLEYKKIQTENENLKKILRSYKEEFDSFKKNYENLKTQSESAKGYFDLHLKQCENAKKSIKIIYNIDEKKSSEEFERSPIFKSQEDCQNETNANYPERHSSSNFKDLFLNQYKKYEDIEQLYTEMNNNFNNLVLKYKQINFELNIKQEKIIKYEGYIGLLNKSITDLNLQLFKQKQIQERNDHILKSVIQSSKNTIKRENKKKKEKIQKPVLTNNLGYDVKSISDSSIIDPDVDEVEVNPENELVEVHIEPMPSYMLFLEKYVEK